MPSGRTHAQFSAPVAIALTAISVTGAFAVHPALTGVAVGAWVGHACTPDIDHHAITHEERRMYRLHPVVGVLWHLYWLPYQKTHAHRGRSHSILIGTLERFVYLLWLPLIASLLLIGVDVLPFWCLVLAAQSFVDMVHIALDRIASAGRMR